MVVGMAFMVVMMASICPAPMAPSAAAAPTRGAQAGIVDPTV
jgi:hypothetical protein